MFEKIKKILDIKNSEIKDKLILKFEDLINDTKINFYFILLKYILKESIFIYQINFLLITRKYILELIRANSNIFLSSDVINLNRRNKDRLNYIIERIIDSKYYINEYIKLNNKNQIKEDISKLNVTKNSDQKRLEENQETMNDKSKIKNYTILELIKMLDYQNQFQNKNKSDTIRESVDFITEIESGFMFITNNKLHLYNKFYDKIKIISFKDWIYNAFELKNLTQKTNDKKNFIIISSKEKIFSYSIDLKNKDNINSEGIHYNNSCLKSLFLLNVNNLKFYCCGEDSVYILGNIFQVLIKNMEYKIFDNILMKSAIKINNNLVAFKSNKVSSKGKDNLFFLDINTNKIIYKIIDEYSFNFSVSGLSIMSCIIERKNKDKIFFDNKILLCACKRYIKNQKNGILLVNIEFNNSNNEFNHHFYDTGNFEVYCFCPLLKKPKKRNEKIFINEIILEEDTNYFLVGGFQPDKNEGIIKLYKVIYDIKLKNIKIEFIQDINKKNSYNNFKRIKKPISCIIQLNKDGKILVGSWDGNLYLFEQPNLDYYMKYDEPFIEMKANIIFKDTNNINE